jgi:hypothetical protein
MILDDYVYQIVSRVEACRAVKAAQAMEARSARETALEAAVKALRGLSGLMRMTHRMAAARQLNSRRMHGEVVALDEAERIMAQAEELDNAA